MSAESKSNTSDSSDLDPQFSTSSDSLDGDQQSIPQNQLQVDGGSIKRNNSNGDVHSNNSTSSSSGNITPPELSIGAQIQSAFTPVTQAFARLSTLASGSNSSSSNMNTTPFWKRKGKVPGTVKPVKPATQRSEKPNGFMARPPTPPRAELMENSDLPHESPGSSPLPISPNLQSPSSPESAYNNSVYSSSPDVSTKPESEYEHHCRSFGSCGTPTEQASRLSKFKKILKNPIVDLEALKKLSWKGIPNEVRATTWKLLLGYLPANADRREATLDRKRKEYLDCIPQHFSIDDEQRTEYERKIYKQIHIDVPRTNPNDPLFQQQMMQDMLERILYIWAIRHPASGYVQGINDLATPFLVVFLSELVGDAFENCEISKLHPTSLSVIEADSFWCMSKLLDGIQDHYTFAQPGIQRMTFKLKELVSRIDELTFAIAPLARHLEEQGAQFIIFAFRWMNCLLMREMPLPIVVRMWDTYLSEGPAEGFSVFHVYVCAAFLVMWSDELRQRDFQDILLFLQHLPTGMWQCKDIEMLVSQAFMWMSIFQNAPSHLKS